VSMFQETPRERHQIDFCCKTSIAGELVPVVQEHGAQVFHCPLRPDHVRFSRELERILRAGQYDVLHNHLATYSGLPVWVAKRTGIPVVTTFHSTHLLPLNPWLKLPGLRTLRSWYGCLSVGYALRNSDFVTTISKGVLRSFDPDGRRTGRRARVTYYGVHLPPRPRPGDRAAFRRGLGWPEETPITIHVGAFREAKNHSGVLAAFRGARARVPAAKLLLVGQGALRPDIERAIADLGLTQAVLSLGLRDDVPRLLGLCDVFLFPSLYEGFALAAVEANAAGLPVVGSDIPGLDEAVQDQETALLHRVDDTEGMADSLAELLTNRSLSKRLGEAGRARAASQFGMEVAMARWLEVYDECARLL